MEAELPELPAQGQWLGIEGSPGWAEFRGRIVLLLFWNPNSIHSQLAMPILRRMLLHNHERPLVVLTVCTARNVREADPELVEARRHLWQIPGPVLIDADARLFQASACRALPSMLLIDAEGAVRYRGSGIADEVRLASALDHLLSVLPPLPVRSELVASPWQPRPGLARLAVDSARDCLWVAASGDNRVLGYDLTTGSLRQVLGTGARGHVDGPISFASFAHPCGLCVVDGKLLVADLENAALREIDLDRGEVRTLIGAGGSIALPPGIPWRGPVALAWQEDLWLLDRACHRLWRIDLKMGTAESACGAGNGLVDGYFATASFAEPNAMVSDGDRLYVLDVETHSLRTVDRQARTVVTQIGVGRAGGDVEGELPMARLWAPQDLTLYGGDLLLADGNGKCRRVTQQRMSTWGALPVGVAPVAVAGHGNCVFVVDARTDRILVLDSEGAPTGPQFAEPPSNPFRQRRAQRQTLGSGTWTLQLATPIPPGMRLAHGYPMACELHCRSSIANQRILRTAEVMGDEVRLTDLPPLAPGTYQVSLHLLFATLDLRPLPALQSVVIGWEVQVELGASLVTELV